MDEYIEKYPNEIKDILTLSFTFTDELADKICKEALKKDKRIELIIDDTKLDYLDYKLV